VIWKKLFNLQSMRTGLTNIFVDKKIAGRYYQEAAVKAVCDSFDRKKSQEKRYLSWQPVPERREP